jgi:hypothetical protein
VPVDGRDERVELLPGDLEVLEQFVAMMRTGRLVSALIVLRQQLTEVERESIAELLRAPKGQSGRWW